MNYVLGHGLITKAVTIISNNLTNEPISTCKHYSLIVKAKVNDSQIAKTKVNFQQPDIIKQ